MAKLVRALPPDKCCSTDLKVVNFSYEWTITNLIFRCSTIDKCDAVQSPTFSLSEADTLQWRLKLSVPATQSEKVTVELVLLNSYYDAVLKCKFSLLGRNREILHDTNWSKLERVESSKGIPQSTVYISGVVHTPGVVVSSVSLMAKSSLFNLPQLKGSCLMENLQSSVK